MSGQMIWPEDSYIARGIIISPEELHVQISSDDDTDIELCDSPLNSGGGSADEYADISSAPAQNL